MPDTRHVSPCCGAECQPNPLYGDGRVECPACGQPCDPQDADLLQRIVREGMERAAKIADERERINAAEWKLNGESHWGSLADECAGIAVAIRAAMEEL